MWERVFTITDFYDRPRKGVANFRGRPHSYESEFSEIEDDYTDRYFLMPINKDVLALVLEDWEIWLRWCNAFHSKQVDLKSHPALPQDRARDLELKQLIGDKLTIDRAIAIVRGAKFRSRDICYDGAEVEWTDPGEQAAKTQ